MLNATQCESSVNPPVNCPSSPTYQPPLPSNQLIDGLLSLPLPLLRQPNLPYDAGTYYPGPLTAEDVDCTSDAWAAAGACTQTFCDRLSAAESDVSFVMSIPYIISAACSPPMVT